VSHLIPHHLLQWLISFFHRVRFTTAAVNPLAGSGRLATHGYNTDSAVMDREADQIPNSPISLAEPLKMESSHSPALSAEPTRRGGEVLHGGVLIINADDWGRDRENTGRIRECALRGTVSSVSAMVFMEDSERAARIASEHGIDAGLHLNFTAPFSSSHCPPLLSEHQRKISSYLLRHRYAQVVFHPGLIRSFEYVVAAQVDEYCRLYGAEPQRLDGHHHQHLCANVLFGRLLPVGTIVRRNFSFRPGQKHLWNRLYRQTVDRILARNHLLVDFLYALAPLDRPGRVERILAMSRASAVEVETHPVNPDEYRFLMGDEMFRRAEDVKIATRFALPRRGHSRGQDNN
jgi:hypothetical protein